MISAAEMKTLCRAYDLEPEQVMVYPKSYVQHEEVRLLMCKIDGVKWILATGRGDFFSRLEGTELSLSLKLCPLTHRNRIVLNDSLPHTRPRAFGRKTSTFGLGDRLGLATPGHIRCFETSEVKPIFAQQSKRELNLTRRTYEQVLDDVCFAVFQEGYHGGFGADGDHLKEIKDIEEALEAGYTMITLDCSEKIGRGIETLTHEALASAYEEFPRDYRTRIEEFYLNKCFPINGREYLFSKDELMRCALVYSGAVDFVRDVYYRQLKKTPSPVDFELSLDETESVTTALGHLFVSLELVDHNIKVTSLAPRFVGEFQKGIDYIGDLETFESHLKEHAAIARHFGYKLSIHSGSDKFKVFPLIGKHTSGLMHIKTSGTNWLEAVGTIAERNPVLYRLIHRKSLAHYEKAKVFYHVTGDPAKVKDPDTIDDASLIQYLQDDNSRQLLHITYGFILEDPVLKSEIYQTLNENEEHYYSRLAAHIGRHLQLMGLA